MSCRQFSSASALQHISSQDLDMKYKLLSGPQPSPCATAQRPQPHLQARLDDVQRVGERGGCAARRQRRARLHRHQLVGLAERGTGSARLALAPPVDLPLAPGRRCSTGIFTGLLRAYISAPCVCTQISLTDNIKEQLNVAWESRQAIAQTGSRAAGIGALTNVVAAFLRHPLMLSNAEHTPRSTAFLHMPMHARMS